MAGERESLEALLARVRGLTGPDREVDAELWWRFADKAGTDRDVLRMAERHGIVAALNRYSGTVWAAGPRPESVTASLDASLALVRASGFVECIVDAALHDGGQSEARIRTWEVDEDEMVSRGPTHRGSGPTPALAVLAALLTAKIAELSHAAA